MPVTVGANSMSVVHAGSSGIAIAVPDVCFTPIIIPIPIPYPNISMSSDLAKGSKKVKADGESIAIEGCNFSTSTGDEGGNAPGGVASGKFKGKAEFILYSMDVKIEGKGVCRAMDMVLANDMNTPPTPVLQGPP